MAANDQNQSNGANGQLFEERRKFIRLDINAEINFSVLPQTQQFHSETKNIGAGGICLMMDNALSKGAMLKLDISLPQDPPPVQAVGRVVWVRSFSFSSDKTTRYDTGVEFVQISDGDRKRINKYVFSIKLK